MPDSKKPNKRRSRRDRRAEILQEATKLFAEYGFEGATLSKVAEAVGLSEPGVLHYFPSKVHLLLGVLEYRDKLDAEKYADMLAAEKKNIGEMFALLEEVYRANEKVPGIIQLFIILVGESLSHEHPSHEFFLDRYRDERHIYTEQLARLTESDLPPDVDLDHLATIIIALRDGLHIQWLLDPENVDLIAVFRLFARMVTAYIDDRS